MEQFIFTTPLQVEETKSGDVFVEGFISTSDKDLVNDIVTQKCLEGMLTQIKERNIKLDLEHEAFRGETKVEMEINKTKIPAARIIEGEIKEKGLWIKGILNKHVPRFNELKGSLMEGFLDAFSIAFIATKTRDVTVKGEPIRMLDSVNLLNVAFTGNPANTAAEMTNVFMKSMDGLKDVHNPNRKPNDPNAEPSNPEEDEEDEDKKKKKKKEKKFNAQEELDGNEDELEVKSGTYTKHNQTVIKEDITMSKESKDNEATETPETETPEVKPEESETEAKTEALKSEITDLKKEFSDLKSIILAGQQNAIDQKSKANPAAQHEQKNHDEQVENAPGIKSTLEMVNYQ